MDDPSRSDADPFAVHREHVASVLPGGDPAAIKRLYVELGDLLVDALDPETGEIPLLSYAETAPVVASLLSQVEGVVLDAGCGPNPAVTVALGSDPRRTVVGVDIGFGTLSLARRVAARVGVKVLGVVGDLEALPFRARAFAGAVCDDTIEHLPDDRGGVHELARVVRVGAPVVLATPNRHRLGVVAGKARDRLHGRRRHPSVYYAATSHLREYSWAELEHLIGPVFRVRRRAAVGWNGSVGRRVASIMTRRGPLRRFSRMIVVEVEPRA